MKALLRNPKFPIKKEDLEPIEEDTEPILVVKPNKTAGRRQKTTAKPKLCKQSGL